MAVYTTIDDPSAYFKVQLYTGTGSSLGVTFNDTDTDMAPNFVWIKNREATDNHLLCDTVRGTGVHLYSNDNSSQSNDAEGLKSFDSDGFTVGTYNLFNTSGEDYVSWNWKESATAGFDIVAYTGTGSAKTESHSLSAVPHLMLVKKKSSGDKAWRVYHHKNTSAPETDYLVLDTYAPSVDDATAWNDTAPTSSVFSVGTSDETNEDTDDFIAYLWTEVQGFSKFGSYVGNGNTNGTFVYTGFQPSRILMTGTVSNASWELYDIKRIGYNPNNYILYADATDVENATAERVDFLSNGFKIRATSTGVGKAGEPYIYMAFAEAPFVNSNGVPCNAK